MSAILSERQAVTAVRPLPAVALVASFPLFLGALLSDYAYWSSHHIQWSNFASWLLAGALVFAAIALVLALVDAFRSGRGRRGGLGFVLAVAATWMLGFINALVHARDAWAAMPTGLVLSVIVVVLASVATWLCFPTFRSGAAS